MSVITEKALWNALYVVKFFKVSGKKDLHIKAVETIKTHLHVQNNFLTICAACKGFTTNTTKQWRTIVFRRYEKSVRVSVTGVTLAEQTEVCGYRAGQFVKAVWCVR
jgi:hypothetical protein